MAKTVTVLAATFCMGVGLCALDYQLGAHGIGRPNTGIGVGPLDGVSILIMVGALLGLAVTLIGWLVSYILTKISQRPR
jgi:hypothetical protein